MLISLLLSFLKQSSFLPLSFASIERKKVLSALLFPLLLAFSQKSFSAFILIPVMHERTVVLCCLAVLLVWNQWDSLFVLFIFRTPKGKRVEIGIGILKERNLYLFRFNSFLGHGSKSWGVAGNRALRAQFPYLQHFTDLVSWARMHFSHMFPISGILGICLVI